MRPYRYRDRRDAGRQLADALRKTTGAPADVVVLGAPRGGVPVAAEIAQALGAPLDVVVAHKLGAPDQPELAVGAIAEGGVVEVDHRLAAMLDITPEQLQREIGRQQRDLQRRVERFREGRPLPPVQGRTVVLVDDGMATGMTMLAAAKALLRRGPRELIAAAPVASHEAVELLENAGARVVCPYVPPMLWAVGAAYEHFPQVSDDDVAELLAAARHREEQAA